MADSALIMQSDASILLDTHAENFEEVRSALLPFAELVKSPEHFHIYRITALSVWNAAACGITLEYIEEILKRYSRYDLSLIHISEPTRLLGLSRMPSSA